MSAPDEQALAEKIVGGMLAKDTFSQWLGIKLLEVGPRAASVRITVRDDMLNGFGLCHGGVTYSLADSALAFASNTHGRVTVSIENSIAYPAPVHPGDVLTAVAEQESESSRLAWFRITVRNQHDVTVALFRGTVYRTQRPFFDDGNETHE